MKRFIYADNAATTKLNKEAFEAMLPWLTDEYGNASQPYSFARSPKKALAEARTVIARCINANPDEIYFTSGGTESDNWAIKSTMLGKDARKEIITSSIEHRAVLKSCEAVENFGCQVTYLDVSNTGVVTPSSLETAISDNTLLVSIMLANNEIGTIQDIRRLTDIAHSYGAVFHTDAVQAVGHIPIDVKELGIDFLSASAHKFNGPKGVGFLYIRNGINIGEYINGGSQESGKRAGTENIPGIVGMAKALEYNTARMTASTKHLYALEELLLRILSEEKIDFIRNGDINHLPGNISLSFYGFSGEALLHRLDLMGIIVSTGSACDSVNSQLSHVIKAIDVNNGYAFGTIRISLSLDNTVDEVEKIARSIIKIVKQ